MKLQPVNLSSIVLTFAGALLMAMGMYFIFLRPPLLPEDLRYMNTSLTIIQKTIPGLQDWVSKVFWVMGSYIFTTGFFTIYIALKPFKSRAPGVIAVVITTGLTSIIAMTTVNFILGSDFKWILLGFSMLWVGAIILHKFHK